MYDFTPMIFTLPMWGSEVANFKTEIHLTNTAGEVGMRCHIYATYRIHFIKGYIALHSCQILSPSETGFIVSAHRLANITLLTLIATL